MSLRLSRAIAKELYRADGDVAISGRGPGGLGWSLAELGMLRKSCLLACVALRPGVRLRGLLQLDCNIRVSLAAEPPQGGLPSSAHNFSCWAKQRGNLKLELGWSLAELGMLRKSCLLACAALRPGDRLRGRVKLHLRSYLSQPEVSPSHSLKVTQFSCLPVTEPALLPLLNF